MYCRHQLNKNQLSKDDGIIMFLSLIYIKLTSHLLFENVCIIFLKSSEIPLKIPKCPSSDCLKYLYPDIIDDICKKKNRHFFIT